MYLYSWCVGLVFVCCFEHGDDIVEMLYISVSYQMDLVTGPLSILLTIRYDTRCYCNVRSKADISQLTLPHVAL